MISSAWKWSSFADAPVQPVLNKEEVLITHNLGNLNGRHPKSTLTRLSLYKSVVRGQRLLLGRVVGLAPTCSLGGM